MTAVYIPAPALSARRHNSQKSEHLPKEAGSVSVHASLKAAKKITVSEQTATGRNEHSFSTQLAGNSAVAALKTPWRITTVTDIINTSIHTIKRSSHLSLPGYYTFLFRYVLF